MLYQKNRVFSEAYNSYYPLIFSTVYYKVGNNNDAEDISQEVFFKLYQKLDEVQNIRKWLYGTLKFEVLMHYRKKKGEEVDIDEVFQDISLTFVNGFRDVRVLIQEAIDNIDNFQDEDNKTLFDLIAVHHFSCENVARQLGITSKKVRYRYNLISRKIVDYFQKKGISSLEDLL